MALFHELLGMGLLKGYEIFATSQNEVYDSLYALSYPADAGLRFEKGKQPLGVSDRLISSETKPKVLEYKHDFEGLLDDFEQEVKSADHIDLVVCWTASKRYKDRFFFRSLLVGDDESERICFGATHQAFSESSQDRRFEVMVLKDLLSYLANPAEEEARQRQYYKDE